MPTTSVPSADHDAVFHHRDEKPMFLPLPKVPLEIPSGSYVTELFSGKARRLRFAVEGNIFAYCGELAMPENALSTFEPHSSLGYKPRTNFATQAASFETAVVRGKGFNHPLPLAPPSRLKQEKERRKVIVFLRERKQEVGHPRHT